MEKSKILYMIRERENGMYKDTYTIVYRTGRVFLFDMHKTGHMPQTHFVFLINAKCIPHYDSRTGVHTSDFFVSEDFERTIKL